MTEIDLLLGIIILLAAGLCASVVSMYKLSVRVSETVLLSGRGGKVSLVRPGKEPKTEQSDYLKEAQKESNVVELDDVPRDDLTKAINAHVGIEEEA